MAAGDSEILARATLDSLSAHIAIVDGSGVIIMVNRAWREFAAANGARSNVSEGANYFDACISATGEESDLAAAFREGMRAVLSGERDEFAMDYPGHSPAQRRWFVGRVTQFPYPGPPRAVVSHEEITALKLRDDALGLRDRAIAASSSGIVITDPGQPDNPDHLRQPCLSCHDRLLPGRDHRSQLPLFAGG